MGKAFYNTPVIERNEPGFMNKYGYGAEAQVCEAIDGARVEDLIREHGSPLYVFSEATLRRKYRAAVLAFSQRYPRTQFAWSYKTNYLQAICQVFHQEGAIAEVVSDFEYQKARKLGIAGPNILVNGPYKTVPFLEQAVADGAKIHLDNTDELLAVEQIAARRKKQVDVAIRVNMDTGMQPAWTKFGFNYENQDAVRAIRRICGGSYLRLAGLHTHIGTFVLEPNYYRVAVEKLLALAEVASYEFDNRLDYFDLGGGFASSNTLHYQYLPGEQIVPSMDQYAEAICEPLNAAFPSGQAQPTLYLETGRAMVDEAGYMLSSIVAQKRMPDGRRAIILDAGVNLLYTTYWYKLKVSPARQILGPLSEAILYGPLCMNIDVIREMAHLPQMKSGDQLVLHPVGAYNAVQSMQFITYRPRVVLIDEQGDVEVIREREDLAHVEAMERLPDHLTSAKTHPVLAMEGAR